MNEPVRQSVPKPGSQLAQIKAALKAAEDRLQWLMGHCPTNQLALRGQTQIIEQYRRQLADLTTGDWLT